MSNDSAAAADRICPSWFTAPTGVPHLPTLGAFHPGENVSCLLRDVFSAAESGAVLPYDKDARWFTSKRERIVPGVLTAEDAAAGVVIPTVTDRRRLTLYCYGEPAEESISELAQTLGARYAAQSTHVVRLHPAVRERPGRGTRFWLHDFTAPLPAEPAPVPGVYVLSECFGPLVLSFIDFAEQMREHGWGFLREQMRERDLGPILVRIHEGRVVGASGPLEIRPDSAGRARLLPQYLGVLPDQRGQGFGRELRRAVVAWARRNGAQYELRQTEIDGVSDQISAEQGARCLGVQHRQVLVSGSTGGTACESV
ncbi:GNAT family N-acetyltransferase [Kineosporia babensis]|uniref:GNAT family N-acetyltransferase n=1 Tax=Kineosporia babensis TaxID=499548 RepID=A0A9X1NJE4_9ACTN|nr:GNAT family N-acetyltransferase [Kineosporia babensis]MCD5314806.1 GNAT family N-acetyltransferase [Kineosporia babensis]